MRAAGFVLTGGRSSRMGCDKALLTIDTEPLVARIASVLETVADPVMLVGRPELFRMLRWSCLSDLRPDAGPLAGIETALAHTAAEWNVIVGCDMPGINKDVLARLLECARHSTAPCVITCDSNGRQHPLLAAYRSRCLPAVRAALDAGHLKLTRLIEEIGAEVLHLDTAVTNLNAPDDWTRWQRDNGR